MRMVPSGARHLLAAALLAAALLALLGGRASAQCELQDLAPPTPATFGNFVAQDGARLVVAGYGSVHVYRQAGRTAFHEQELAVPGFELGSSQIRALALDGDRLAVTMGSVDRPGMVHVYERGPGGWAETSAIEGGRHDTNFGDALALAGELLAVADPREDSGALRYTGAVHVYEHHEGLWSESTRLVPAFVRATEGFGAALDFDGDRLAVGATLFADLPRRAYVFERTDAGWRESRLAAPAGVSSEFGRSLDLHGDRLLISDPSFLHGFGGAWIYDFDGVAWSRSAALAPRPDEHGRFGAAVALGGDGDVALIGAPWDGERALYAGAVHVFEQVAGAWVLREKLLPDGPRASIQFGQAVSCEGDLALVGMPGGERASSYSPRESLCRTLFAQPEKVSLTRGGRQTLRLNPGREHAGRTFVLMGSATGFEPGIALGGVRIPLVPDAYFWLSLLPHRRSPLVNNVGVLGRLPPQAEVTIDVPPGTSLALAGLTLYHAFVVLERGIVDVSNVRTLALVP